MKLASGIVAVALALVVASNGIAALPAEFNNKGHFEELRVTTTEDSPIVLGNANISDGVILGKSSNVNFDAVKKLEYKTGNHATAGSIWGGVIGCGIGVAVAMGTKKTETDGNSMFEVQTTTIQTWPIYLIGIGGSLLGMAMGSGSHTYSTLYNGGANTIGASQRDWRIGVAPGSRGEPEAAYVTLSCRF